MRGRACPYDRQHGDIVCRDGVLWALTYSEMGPPDSRQHHGECPYCCRTRPGGEESKDD